jgi:hypothetical protein
MMRNPRKLTARYFLVILWLVPSAGKAGQAAAQTALTEIQTSLFSNVKLLPPMEPMENARGAAPTAPVAKLSTSSFTCAIPLTIDLTAGCRAEFPPSSALWVKTFDPLVGKSILKATVRREKFHWSPALWQSLEFLVLEHTFRLANDPGARYLLLHKPFWHDYAASADHFDMNRWGDGDSFLVNFIGHPMQGAVSGDIFLQNDPQGRSAKFGKSSAYWQSRLKAMGWAAVYSAYFEIGPILSETAIGNEGGYTYVPGCGLYPTCKKEPGVHYKPPTNNTGWVDFIVTPVVGMGWIVLEDAIETELVDRVAKDSPALKYKILRGSLAPSHTLANALAGKTPWYRYPKENSIAAAFGGTPLQPVTLQPEWKSEPRWGTGVQFVSTSLPTDRENCAGCRSFRNGAGFNFNYRFARYAYLDSEVDFLPGNGEGFNQIGGAREALLGLKIGYTSRSWGLFSQVRPGVIHYDKTLVPGSGSSYESATRFALDLGGVFEYYPSRHSTLRVKMGTTLVRYLQAYADPKQPPTSVLSDQYYSVQGNFQIATGYQYRF